MSAYAYQSVDIPTGVPGVRDTLKIMRALALEGRKSPAVRMAALSACGAQRQKDFTGEARCITDFVRDEIRYVRDIKGIETVQTADTTLDVRQGDCDDKCVLLAAMLLSVSHPVRFVAVGMRPGHFSHVSVQTRIGSRWVWAETTEPWPFGTGPRHVPSFMLQHV